MKYTIPTLETERLILRKGAYEDYVKVYEYDFTRLKNIAGEFEFIKCDPEKIRGFETYADEEDNVLDFILFLKDTNEPVGNITYDRYDKDKKSLEISANTHPNYWRKGYMTEALIKSMKYIFDNLDINEIIYGFAKDNFKSQGLCEKLGFEFKEEYVEHYIRLNKDIESANYIMTKEKFNELYK